MTNPTSNFGWQMPTSTDLVTDLPADFEVFGQAVDTSLADLKGGTTGQILAKASNTNMDFTWVTNEIGDITAVTAGTGLSGGGTSGAVTLSIDTATTVDLTTAQTMTNKTLTSPVLTTPTISTINAKGDLLAGTADNTIAALTVGANNTVLTADSSTATGLKWAAAAGGGKVLQVVQGTHKPTSDITIATSTLTDTNLTASITPSSASSKVLVMVAQHALGYRSYFYSGSKFALLRDSTQIGDTIVSGTNSFQFFAESITGTGFGIQGWYSYTILDSPATTSSTTYKIQMAPNTTANSGQVQIQAGFQSNIILMEIGA